MFEDYRELFLHVSDPNRVNLLWVSEQSKQLSQVTPWLYIYAYVFFMRPWTFSKKFQRIKITINKAKLGTTTLKIFEQLWLKNQPLPAKLKTKKNRKATQIVKVIILKNVKRM